jgi:hypothetical protein
MLFGSGYRALPAIVYDWLRFHEKGGKELEAPCIPKLETYLDEHLAAAGIAHDKDGPLFRTTGRSTGTPQRMWQQGRIPADTAPCEARGHENGHR